MVNNYCEFSLYERKFFRWRCKNGIRGAIKKIMKRIHHTAKKFIRKLKGAVTFDSVAEYLQSEGYAIIYYSSPECHALTEEYGMANYIKSVNAFTYCCDRVRFVFINDKIPLNEMLCSILHEAAHIYLGHLSTNPYATDNRLNEMEAEAFAYAVLTYKKSYSPYWSIIKGRKRHSKTKKDDSKRENVILDMILIQK